MPFLISERTLYFKGHDQEITKDRRVLEIAERAVYHVRTSLCFASLRRITLIFQQDEMVNVEDWFCQLPLVTLLFNSTSVPIICVRINGSHALRLISQTGKRAGRCPVYSVTIAASETMALWRDDFYHYIHRILLSRPSDVCRQAFMFCACALFFDTLTLISQTVSGIALKIYQRFDHSLNS